MDCHKPLVLEVGWPVAGSHLSMREMLNTTISIAVGFLFWLGIGAASAISRTYQPETHGSLGLVFRCGGLQERGFPN